MNPVEKQRLQVELAAHLEKHHVLSNAAADSIAASYGLSRRSVRRQAAIVAGRVEPAPRPEDAPFGTMPLEEVYAHYLDVNANMATLHARLSSMGVISYSERTLNRRVEDHVISMVAQFADKGYDAFHDAAVWNSNPPSLRNQIWEADYMTVKALVVMPRSSTAVQAKIGLVVDRGTSMILSAIVCDEAPTGPDTVAMFCGATVERTVVVDGVEVVVGGKPDVVLLDNASDMNGKSVMSFVDALGVDLRTTHPYSGWEKPYVESLNRCIQDSELNSLPARTRGPQDQRGSSMYGDEPILTFDGLVLIVSNWVNAYNQTTKEAWGESPLQRWAAQDNLAPLKRIPAEQMRYAAIPARQPRKVSGKGINFNNLRYSAPEIHRPDLRGKFVDVASYPGVPEFIEVFYEDEWLCRAQVSHTLDDAQREACRAQRAAAKRITLLAAQRVGEMRAARAHDSNAEAAALLAEAAGSSVNVMASETIDPESGRVLTPTGSDDEQPAAAALPEPAAEPTEEEAVEPAAKLALAPEPEKPQTAPAVKKSEGVELVTDVLARLTGRSAEPATSRPDDDAAGVA